MSNILSSKKLDLDKLTLEQFLSNLKEVAA
jgi:hypothetical protein